MAHEVEEEEREQEEQEQEEQVMSEIHLGCPPNFSGAYLSQFTFSIPPTDISLQRSVTGLQKGAVLSKICIMDDDAGNVVTQGNHTKDSSSTSSTAIMYDDDGDLILSRRENLNLSAEYVLTIQHSITSSLPNVGLQVWRAALLLADFILHMSSISNLFHGITALELGAGTGLVGILLARVAKTIFLTDIGKEVLHNCEDNVHLNSGMFSFDETCFKVRELNWKKAWPPNTVTCESQHRTNSKYSWTIDDIQEAEDAQVLLAADVIYSDELTDSLFNLLDILMSCGSEKVLYLALEKRYNFTLEDLDVVANGYAHFRSFLMDTEYDCDGGGTSPHFVGEQIDTDQIPQYISKYDRGKDLELWKITYAK